MAGGLSEAVWKISGGFISMSISQKVKVVDASEYSRCVSNAGTQSHSMPLAWPAISIVM